MSVGSLYIYCTHTSENFTRCNRYKAFPVEDKTETPEELVEDSDWGFEDGEPRCEEHKP